MDRPPGLSNSREWLPVCTNCTKRQKFILKQMAYSAVTGLTVPSHKLTPEILNLVSDIAETAPFESQLTREWALRIAAKCALVKSGLTTHQVDAYFPEHVDKNLWSTVHTLLVSPFSGPWFRRAVEVHGHDGILDGDFIPSWILSGDQGDEDPVLEKFISLALAVQGRPVGGSPGEEMALLGALERDHAHLFRFLEVANTRREAQTALWLRDLASHNKLLKWRPDILIRLKKRIGIPPRAMFSPLLHSPIMIDLIG